MLNVDKAGHFFGGFLVADMFQGSLQWAGGRKKRLFIRSSHRLFVQLGIEMKDAYALWGFSVWDFGGNTADVLMLKDFGELQKIDFKMSYYKRSNHWDLGIAQKPYAPPDSHVYQDDYVNQTY